MTLHLHATRFVVASILIAIGVYSTSATGQISSKTQSSVVGPVVQTEQVRAELLAYAPDGVQSGKPLWLGLQIMHQPHWHTYWKNPGDSGLPTVLQWTLPEGISASEIAWPTPKKIPIGTLANYGFEGTTLLPVTLTVGPQFKGSVFGQAIDIRLKASWLVCRRECIPQEGDFALRLPMGSATAMNRVAFEQSLAQQPQALAVTQSATDANAPTATVHGDLLELAVRGLPATFKGRTLAYFPETGDVIDNAPAGSQAWDQDTWRVQIPISAQRGLSPTQMPFVLALTPPGSDAGDSGASPAIRVDARVVGAWPPLVAQAVVPPALQTALAPGATGSALNGGASSEAVQGGLWVALLGALLGGMILNLMPCVFPVLAIKVMAIAKHANDRHAHRVSGAAYTVGVVLSFVALGALMLALRAAGDQLGWGFQLQSPAVVTVLAVLFTLMGLNLAGLFEFGQMLPSSLSALQARSPVLNALLSGVLAVAIASPCTAPFMGASLGLAISLPTVQALWIFAAMGLGMALPFLLASMVPALAGLLPRPGAWMDTFRRFMAFPMFATVVWLVWVLGQQTGIDGAGALLAILLGVAMAVWALALPGRTGRWFAPISIAVCAGLIWSVGPNVVKPVTDELASLGSASTGSGDASASGTAGGNANGKAGSSARWQPWEPGRVEQVLASGQPVFVDFTAAWCVTCQYNKKMTLADAGVLADIDAKKVQLLRADWTRRDPAISAALSQLGRSGVPVYVLYQVGKAPVVLSEILSVKEVRALLASV